MLAGFDRSDDDPANANAAYLGPGQNGGIGRGDTRTGSQRGTILLDTTGSSWRVFFLVDDLLIGSGDLSPPATASAMWPYQCLRTRSPLSATSESRSADRNDRQLPLQRKKLRQGERLQ